MKWNIEDDKFVWEISEKLMSAKSKKPVTRQGILSVVYSLGFIAPYIIGLYCTLYHEGKADTSDVKLKEDWMG